MDKIFRLNDVQTKGTKGDPANLIHKLNKAVSQSEYGRNFCEMYYDKDYIDGLIDTVKNDCKYVKTTIAQAQKALKSHSIDIKNQYLKSRTNEKFDKFVSYNDSQLKDANQDIKADIHDEKLVLKQLKQYHSDTVVEESGCVNNCIHPLKYSRIKYLLDYDYIK